MEVTLNGNTIKYRVGKDLIKKYLAMQSNNPKKMMKKLGVHLVCFENGSMYAFKVRDGGFKGFTEENMSWLDEPALAARLVNIWCGKYMDKNPRNAHLITCAFNAMIEFGPPIRLEALKVDSYDSNFYVFVRERLGTCINIFETADIGNVQTVASFVTCGDFSFPRPRWIVTPKYEFITVIQP